MRLGKDNGAEGAGELWNMTPVGSWKSGQVGSGRVGRLPPIGGPLNARGRPGVDPVSTRNIMAERPGGRPGVVDPGATRSQADPYCVHELHRDGRNWGCNRIAFISCQSSERLRRPPVSSRGHGLQLPTTIDRCWGTPDASTEFLVWPHVRCNAHTLSFPPLWDKKMIEISHIVGNLPTYCTPVLPSAPPHILENGGLWDIWRQDFLF
eukprot:gene20569-biopygen14637